MTLLVDFKKIDFPSLEKEILLFQKETSEALEVLESTEAANSHQNKNRKEFIIANLSTYIYYFPKLAFRVGDEDLLAEFYLYVFERMDKVLEKFDSKMSGLSTYLGIRLRTYWLNFITHKSKQNQKALVGKTISLASDEIASIGGTNSKDDGQDYNSENYQENILELNEEQLFADTGLDALFFQYFPFKKKDLTDLETPRTLQSAFKYLVMKLYYFDFFHNDDFILLKEYLGVSYGKALKIIDDFREKLSLKQIKQNQGEDKLISIFNRLVQSKEKGQQKYSDLLKQQKVILDNYYKVKDEPAVKDIAQVMQEKNARKVWNIIQYQKRVAKDNLKKTLAETEKGIKEK